MNRLKTMTYTETGFDGFITKSCLEKTRHKLLITIGYFNMFKNAETTVCFRISSLKKGLSV